MAGLHLLAFLIFTSTVIIDHPNTAVEATDTKCDVVEGTRRFQQPDIDDQQVCPKDVKDCDGVGTEQAKTNCRNCCISSSPNTTSSGKQSTIDLYIHDSDLKYNKFIKHPNNLPYHTEPPF